MKNTFSININATPATVFKWIYDSDLNLQWLPNLVENEVLESRPGGVGSRFRQAYVENGRRMEMTGIVTAYEQDRLLACAIAGQAFDLQVDYQLEELGGYTRVTQRSEVLFKGFMMRLIGGLMKPMMRKMSARQSETAFGKLKTLAEADKD